MNDCVATQDHQPSLTERLQWKFQAVAHFFTRCRYQLIRMIGGVPACYDNNLVAHAENEMALAWPKQDDMQDAMKRDLLDLVAVFSAQGHSGSSASYALARIQNLMAYKPLTSLTGEDHEWADALDPDDDIQQNKRLPAVFKKPCGTAFYLNAIVWQGEDEGDTFTGTVDGVSSRQTIAFPFSPKIFYIDVKQEPYDVQKHGEDVGVYEHEGGNYVYVIKDRSQLEQVWQHYVRPV